MKLTLTELKFFIFCFLNAIAITIGVAQNTPINNNTVQDSLNINGSDNFLKTPFGVFDLNQTTSAIFRVSGDELRKTPGDNLSEALRGRVPGLRIVRQTNTPGAENGYNYILNGSTPFVLIDGQPRGLQVDLREVEEVIVLNDATFNSLLGPLGSDGLIYVVTKGGKFQKPSVEVNLQRSINIPTRLPNLLSASEYATVVNQAANNDGLADIYSQEAIQAYRDGSNPLQFPNVNAQDEFLDAFSFSNFASIGIYGGKDKVTYGAFVGYSDWTGLEKVGKQIDGRNITFRTKIKARMNNFIEAHASIYGKFGENERPVTGADQMFSWISGTPANAFPLKVGDSAYIVSNEFRTQNVLSELEDGGNRTDYTSNMIFDLGLDFDLNKFIPNLKYDTYFMLRTFNSQVLQNNRTPELFTLEFSQDIEGNDITNLLLSRTGNPVTDVARSGSGILRIFSYGGNFSYIKNMQNSKLILNLNHLLYNQPNPASSIPDTKNLVFNLNGSFSLKDKYSLFANLNSSSSSKFIGNNRSAFFPTVGFAWVASNENFLKNSKSIDFLKFRTSFGQIGAEYTSSTFLYLDTWTGGRNNNNTPYFGTGGNNTIKFAYRPQTIGNENIDWVVRNQTFAGVELNMFKKLNFNFNYFNITSKGQITQANPLYSNALGSSAYLPSLNFNDVKNEGFNTNLTFNDNIGNVNYYIGVNAGYNKTIRTKFAEIPHPEEYRLLQGQANDVIVGYVSDGLFTAENIGSALPQLSDVQVGDIRYVDQNGDNVIDARDQRAIGNFTPRLNYGINLGVTFSHFNIDVVGMGVAGFDLNLNNFSYYDHGGLGVYFGNVNSNLPNGNTKPRLSTTQIGNNNANSDYWLVDGSYFRISNLELGFTIPENIVSNDAIGDIKLFLRGSNLALFSKVKDLDPEDLRSGIFEYPMMRSLVFGASVNF